MANTTVSIRERVKTADGRWTWSPKIPIPEGKLKPAEAQRTGSFYLVYTEHGKKQEPKVKGKTFEAAVAAARAKQRHLEDAADGFPRPDPLRKVERKKISEAIEDRLRRIEISFDWKTLKAHKQALSQFEKWIDQQKPKPQFVDEITHDHIMAFRNWLLKNGNEKRYSKKKGNDKLTADWKELMQKIVNHMNDPTRPDSRLVFCTASGRPDTHLWDKLQAIAKRAGMGGFDLKTFRATRATDWLRPRELGGCGYDIQTVRDLLGHDPDSESIWSYLRAVDKEIIVAEMNKRQEEASETQRRIEMSKGIKVSPNDHAVFASGVAVAQTGFPLAR